MTHFLLRTVSRSGFWALAAVLTAGLASTSILRADDSSQGATARLSLVDGGVRVAQGGQVVADPAPVNAPVFEGAQLATAEDGKAEIQFEDGSVARLSPNSALTLTTLSGQQGAEVVLDGGLAYFEVPEGGSRQMRIRFGDSVVTASAGAVLRIRFDTPPGELAVFAGVAHLERFNAPALDLETGQSVRLDPNVPGRYTLDAKIDPDSWDGWNQDRDQALNTSASNQSGAAASVIGEGANTPAWSDLDANGSWYNVPNQGYIWSPYSASNAGWDPYGCGHWMWTPRWGYVWVSCESWGFMPYMCGSWSYYDSFGWGWGPGMGMSCRSGMWGAGYFGGIHIGNAPGGYRLLERPGPKRPVARIPSPILVDRRTPGTVGGLPPRNSLVSIGGQSVRPIARTERPSYDRSSQGFDNRTAPTRPGGQVNPSGMSYGAHQIPGSPTYTLRSGYNQVQPGTRNNYVHTGGPVPTTPGSTQPQQHAYQPQQQQQRNYQPQQQQQRNYQPPQHNYQPSAPSYHSAPAPSAPSAAHSNGGGNSGGHK